MLFPRKYFDRLTKEIEIFSFLAPQSVLSEKGNDFTLNIAKVFDGKLDVRPPSVSLVFEKINMAAAQSSL